MFILMLRIDFPKISYEYINIPHNIVYYIYIILNKYILLFLSKYLFTLDTI